MPAHNYWNQTKNDQLFSLFTLSKMFLKYFPNKIVYSAIGSTDAAPSNM
jgi:sphingomyelin phosphodiesterase